MTCVQIFPLGNATANDLKRFINTVAQIEPTFAQIEQASYDVRVGYAGFKSQKYAEIACEKLHKAEFNGNKVRARIITPVEDEYGILVGPKGFVQEGNYESNNGSRYYPGQQASSPTAGSSKKHTNRRSYQQQQSDPRNFGGIATSYKDFSQLENQPNISYQQNLRYPPASPNGVNQYQDQGFEQRSMGIAADENNSYERISQSKDSKSKSSSRHRRHRRDSSDSSSSSSSSSSESSDSSSRQSRRKHRHHHRHHRKSK